MGSEMRKKDSSLKWYLVPFLVVLFLLLVPVVLVWILIHFIFKLTALVLVWLLWSTRGITLLTVYSNSPHWQDYFEKGVLPLVSNRSQVLNWSNRSQWTPSLKTVLFSLFKGETDYNPMILRLTPLSWPKQIRFYQAFKDAKHGNLNLLQICEKELSEWLDTSINLDHLHPHPRPSV